MDIQSLVEAKPNPNIASFRPGDRVKVYSKVVEGDRERIQAFEGDVIRVRGGRLNSNFTVRRISHGVGVERTFPFYSPLVEKVEVTRWGHVRRAKLYYLRDRIGKAARIKASSRSRQQSTAQAEQFASIAVQAEAATASVAEVDEAAEMNGVVEQDTLAADSEPSAQVVAPDAVMEEATEPETPETEKETSAE